MGTSQDDRQVLGHENPNWIIGLNNTFVYKDFRLDYLCNGTLRSDYL